MAEAAVKGENGDYDTVGGATSKETVQIFLNKKGKRRLIKTRVASGVFGELMINTLTGRQR